MRELSAHATALPMYLGFLLETPGGAGGGVAAGLRKVDLLLGAYGKGTREVSQALRDACPRLEVRGKGGDRQGGIFDRQRDLVYRGQYTEVTGWRLHHAHAGAGRGH